MSSYELHKLLAAVPAFLCRLEHRLGGYRASVDLRYRGLGHLDEPDGDCHVFLHCRRQRLSRMRDF
jgi:hypothetical protein